MMDTQRLILLVIFSFSLLMLWEAWEKEKRPKPAAAPPAAQQSIPLPSKPPAPTTQAPGSVAPSPATVPAAAAAQQGEIVRVSTDLIVAEVDTLGGTLKRVELLRHKDSKDLTKNLSLLGPEHHYEAQSGLAGEGGPNHRTLWRVQPGERALAPGKDAFELRFTATGKDGLEVQKVYTFRRGSYVVDVALEIRNPGSAPRAPRIPISSSRTTASRTRTPTPWPKRSARRASSASPSIPTSASSRRCIPRTSTRAMRST